MDEVLLAGVRLDLVFLAFSSAKLIFLWSSFNLAHQAFACTFPANRPRDLAVTAASSEHPISRDNAFLSCYVIAMSPSGMACELQSQLAFLLGIAPWQSGFP